MILKIGLHFFDDKNVKETLHEKGIEIKNIEKRKSIDIEI